MIKIFIFCMDLVAANLCGSSGYVQYLVSGPRGVNDEKMTHSLNEDRPTHKPSNARLYNTKTKSWCPFDNESSPYIQVEFNSLSNVTGVVIQGQNVGLPRWAKEYNIRYSEDGFTWEYVRLPNGTEKTFPGNTDFNTPVIGKLEDIIPMRLLRIYPTSWYNKLPCMRFDVLGCQSVNSCDEFLVFGPDVQSCQVTSSSSRSNTTCPQLAKLDGGSSWCPSEWDNSTSFIQVELDNFSKITGVVTQGSHEAPEWIANFFVRYSENGSTWQEEKGFLGNIDQHTWIFHPLDNAVHVRFLRIYPENFIGYPCLRFDVLGCREKQNYRVNLQNYTSAELDNMVKQVKDVLKKDRKRTNLYIRSKTSATDDRTSSKAIGYVGVIIICAIGAGVGIMDIPNLLLGKPFKMKTSKSKENAKKRH